MGRVATLLTLFALLGAHAGAPGIAAAYALKHTEGGQPVGWRSRSIRLHVSRRLSAHFSEPELRFAVETAVDAWKGLPRVPELVIASGPAAAAGYRSGSPSNGIYLRRDWPFAEHRLAVTVTTYDAATGNILDADIMLHGGRPLGTVAAGPTIGGRALPAATGAPGRGRGARSHGPVYDLSSVLTHEVGHVLGLDESLDDARATMWPEIGAGDTHQRTLGMDDKLGVLAAYEGVALGSGRGCGGATVRSSSTPTGPVPLVLFAALALGVARRRRIVAGIGLVAVIAVTVVAPGAVARPTSAAHKRLDALVASAEAVHEGVAVRQGVEEDRGLLWTRYSVETRDGTAVTLRVPGGERDGIVQHGGSVPPRDGQPVVVFERTGSDAWALRDGDSVRGGWLGAGGAVSFPVHR